MNFHQFYDKLNGKMYTDPRVPPPVKYDLEDYLKYVTNDPRVNGTEDGTWELKPLDQEDMKRYAHDDVVDAFSKMHNGNNPNRLGPLATDEDMRKYTGMRSPYDRSSKV